MVFIISWFYLKTIEDYDISLGKLSKRVSVQQLTVKCSISTHHLAGVSLPEQKREREYALRAQREGKQTGGCVDEDMRTNGTKTQTDMWVSSHSSGRNSRMQLEVEIWHMV